MIQDELFQDPGEEIINDYSFSEIDFLFVRVIPRDSYFVSRDVPKLSCPEIRFGNLVDPNELIPYLCPLRILSGMFGPKDTSCR